MLAVGGSSMRSFGHHVAPICHDYFTRCILFRVLVAWMAIPVMNLTTS